MSLLPPIGASGIYVLNAPFNTKLQANVSYRCEAVRRIVDLVEAGADPYAEIYAPNNQTQQKYEQDVLNDVCIVSLQNASGHWVYVPSSFVKSFPNINGVPYHTMVLGVELGPIPEYMDLTVVKTEVATVVRDVIGITPSVKEVVISPVQNFSQRDHDIVEANRVKAITYSDTWKAKYVELERKFRALQKENDELVRIVASK